MSQSPANPIPPRPGGGRWKLLVIALLVIHVGLMVSVALVAGRGDQYTIVPDYYRRAIHFDQEQELRRQSAALGWKVGIAAAAEADPTGQRIVTFHLVDAGGAGIADATLAVMYFAHVNGEAIRNVRFTASDCREGKFTTALPMPAAGLWEFQLRAEARGQTYIQTTQLTIGTPGRTP